MSSIATAHEQIVDVVAAKVGVAVCRDHFEDAIVKFEDRNIERPAAQVINSDDTFLFAIKSVGERGGRGFIHQAQDFEASHAARVFRRLALRVVEVCRHRDHGLRDRRAEVALGIALELAENVRRDFRGRVLGAAEQDAQHFARLDVGRKLEWEKLQLFSHVFDTAAHQALDGVDRAIWRCEQRGARSVADNDAIADCLARLRDGDRDNRRY